MKLCFITTVSMTLEAFVREQAKAIHEKHPDWQIYFICDNDEKFGNSLEDYIKFIPVSMSRGIDLGAAKSVFALKKLFKREKFDMIVYATPNASLCSSLAGKMAGIKKRLYCQWGIRYVGFSGIKHKIFKFLEKLTCKNSTLVNAVSYKNRQFSIDEKLYTPEKATVVGNGGTVGVDLTLYDIGKYDIYRAEKRKELGLKDEFIYGFVGRLGRDKGAFELLSAFRNISEIRSDVKLLCIGPTEMGENDVPSELKEWAQTNENVVFIGNKPKEEVVKYYAAMDVYVHPSYREGFGMVLQEAGAMKCPIITTDIPGAGEVLVNGQSCLLCNVKDADSLTECMKKLVNDKDYCQKLGINARKYVEEKYERNSMVKNHVKRYEEILGV